MDTLESPPTSSPTFSPTPPPNSPPTSPRTNVPSSSLSSRPLRHRAPCLVRRLSTFPGTARHRQRPVLRPIPQRRHRRVPRYCYRPVLYQSIEKQSEIIAFIEINNVWEVEIHFQPWRYDEICSVIECLVQQGYFGKYSSSKTRTVI
jgi:hypothetical protein